MIEYTNSSNQPNSGGYNAYKKTQKQAAEDYRVTEANALLRCAALLEEAKNPDLNYLEYAEVLRHNQNLWTMFQAALADPENPLPAPLKDTLKGLSIYVDRRTLRALHEQKPELLNVLININKEIAGGLLDSYKRDQSTAQQQGGTAGMASSGASGQAGIAAQGQATGNAPAEAPRVNVQIF